MSDPDSRPSSARRRFLPQAPASLRGMLLMMLAVAMFSVMDTMAKYLTETYDVVQVVWARYMFHLLLMLAFVQRRDALAMLRSTRPGLQLTRSLFLVASTFFFVTAISFIPLADATAIGFVSPLLVTALSIPILGEKVGIRRWTAVIVGFLGVLVILRPGLGVMHWAAVLPLFMALCFAFYQITTRLLRNADPAMTTLFYSALVGVAVMSVAVPWVWIAPTAVHWVMMVAIGVIGGLSHFILIKAYALAQASTLAPFVYTQILWVTILGYLVFEDVPDLPTILGAVIVVGSGLYVFYRENVLRRQRAQEAR